MAKAKDKKHAKKIVEKQDPDYVVGRVYVLNENNLLNSGAYKCKDEGEGLFVAEEDIPKKMGQATQLECGT